ncbi:WPP domain-associated protein [Brassica napus]|uniref:WPP domain-associated protein n=1 Tax=Brassica napus TaxID=3708 RepID=UPI0020790771|nr:WPP domain-associated protein [Brassica napus]
MKDIMKEVEGKVKFSMADSTMMLLVQQAMDKAHEKIKTKHGLLLRLNAISLFYELAVLQLQSCLNFVQQETDNLESNHEEVVRDLRKIKDRLHHRLLETELAILEKDRELLERSENEASLRNVLESKETELVHLQDLERKRSSCNEIGEEFSELKSSVDHQVMNLRQKIETEYDGLGKEADDPSGVDIDVLKGTMDLAFNKMHHAIFLSELGPIEQSWRWSVERETMGLLIKGFMSGLEEEKKRVMMVVRDYELGFKDRVCLIRREVECLESQIIIQRSSSSPRAITTSSSSVDCEVVNDDKEEEGEGEEDSSNYPVSKLIKSHESIIRRKSEELVSPKIESIKRQRSCNSSSSKRAVDDIVSGLDSLVCLNTKMFEYFCYDEDDDRCDEHEVVMDDGLDDVWKKVQKHRAVLSGNEVEEKEDVEMKLMILEDTYLTLLRGLLTDNKRLLVEQEKMACLDKSLVFDGYESLCEDEVFRQEVNLIIVREFLREMSETVENHERVKADNRRLFEEQGKWACLDTSPVFNDLEILREDEECRQEVDWIIVRELLREFSETVENHERTEADNKRLFEEQVKRACLDRSIVSDDFEILREGEEFRQEVDSITVTELLREVSETVDNQERIQANNKRLLEKEGKMACLDTSLAFDDFEILCEDGVFRQEVDWIVVRELLREVSETVENLERIEAENKRLLEEQGKRACMEIFLVFDDFNFKIQERLKMATLGLQNLGKNIDSTMDYMAELRRKESVYKTAFVLRCENLIKAETEVDLLGDQVDSLVKLLQKTLWTFHQHPLLLCNHSDISEICKMIKEVLCEDYKAN